MRHEYVLVDVFTDRPFAGNQLAVFLEGGSVPERSLQAIARELNLPETSFVMPPSAGGDHCLRIFTPARELPFAGHPTVGFSTETVSADASVHGRMFAPWQGIAEDPATGSACGPLGAYLVRHGVSDGRRIVVEQGFEMGRPSLLVVRVASEARRITSVHVGGRCATVGGGWLNA